MSLSITLVSHALCPHVQRIAIALAEKGVVHERVTIDLANKPGWFLALPPLGRTPVLKVSVLPAPTPSAALRRGPARAPRPRGRQRRERRVCSSEA